MYCAVLIAVLAVNSTPPLAVTEAEFLATLEQGHPAYAALGEAEGLARAEVIQASTFDNPEIEIVREAPTAADEQIELIVAWQPPRPGRRRLAMASAESAVSAAQADALAERREVRIALRQTFAEWAVASARVEHSRTHVGRMSDLVERESHRADQGETSGLEVRLLKLAVAAARGQLALDEAAVLKARGTVRGWRPDLPAEAVPVLPTLPGSTSTSAARHPRLTALTAELESARLDREAASMVAGWPQLVAGWQRQEEAEGPILGLAWTVPLADRGRAERGRAQARVEAAEARLEHARRQVEAERAGALGAYERLATAARAALGSTSDNAMMIEAATTAFHYGEGSLADLLETLSTTLESELGALELHAAALAAHRDLESATGQALATPVP